MHVFFRLCFRDRIMEDALHRSVHLFTGWAGEASLSRGSCHVAAGYARAAVRASTPAGARKPVPGDFQTAGEETAQKEGGVGAIFVAVNARNRCSTLTFLERERQEDHLM